jgi:thymidylate synthase (FAD)
MNNKNTVELLEYFGNDLMVVNCARASYDKQSTYIVEKDVKLLKYLYEHKHIAPFYHPKIQFRITCPIYVERQLTKTSVGVNLNQEIDVDINSISGRYVDFSDSYTTITKWRKQAKSSKQGSDGLIDNQQLCCDIEATVLETCKMAYAQLLALGVSKEQARTILPLNLNTTFVWTGSLYALLRLCELRLKPDAQYETRIVVEEMLQLIKEIPGNPFEYSIKAFGL